MENMMKEKMFNFEDLRLYQKSLDFIDLTYSITSHFPDDAKMLSEDFRKTSEKIALFIAEGSGENKSQFINLLRNSKGCVRECLVFSTIAFRRNFINTEQEAEFRDKLIELAKMLGGLITSLQNRLKTNRPHHTDPNTLYDTNENENELT